MPRPEDVKVEIRNKLNNQYKKLVKTLGRMRATSLTRYQELVQDVLKESLDSTEKTVKNWLNKEIRDEAKKGTLSAESKTPPDKRKKIKTAIAARVAKSKASQAYIEIDNRARQAYKQVWQEVNSEIESAKGLKTVKEVQKSISTKLAERGVLEVRYTDGTVRPLDAYAEMVSRTSRTQTFNRAALEYAADTTDLVECTTIFPTCEICIKFQGRVYSISGNDKRFPALYDTALAAGFEAIHPNCRHQFLPYHEELDQPRERAVKEEISNKPFEDNRTEHNRRQYAEWQADNAKKAERRRQDIEDAV